jgi:signal transduction histidine kinase
VTERPPRLTVAIEASVSSDGRLISADPHLMRLHRAGGGVEGGILAIPPLLSLARLAWRTGSEIERSAIVADGDLGVDLWVSARKRTDHVMLSVFGWQEVAIRQSPNASLAVPPMRGLGRQANASIILDSTMIIISIAPQFLDLVGLEQIGAPVTDVLDGVEADDFAKLQPQQSSEANVRLRDNGLSMRMGITRLNHADGRHLGYECRFLSDLGVDVSAASDTSRKTTSMGFGRQFASAVRQPLSRIIANAETIGGHIAGPIEPSYAGYAQDIASAARHLAELVSDLEDLDAIDREDFRVASERVELVDIAHRVAGLLALKAADHHINFVLPPRNEAVEALGEFRRVLQIMLNLVGNAIRYAPDGSVVRISVGRDPISISVSDEGHGIPVEDRERVFEKFERLGRSGDGGSGLGLYISRRLARAMQGELVIGESAEGGAKFTLSLPAFVRD